ncbi:hypothetical protein ACIBSV_43625 [Embleya sp. NPDC050154]
MSWANPMKNSATQRRDGPAGACAFVVAMTWSSLVVVRAAPILRAAS